MYVYGKGLGAGHEFRGSYPLTPPRARVATRLIKLSYRQVNIPYSMLNMPPQELRTLDEHVNLTQRDRVITFK